MASRKGSPNVNPSKASVILELKARGIEFLKVYWDLIEADTTPIEQKVKLLTSILEFIYAKRRPEDSSGTPDESGAPIVIVSDEQLGRLVKGARGK